jgi:succinate dehydrogenase / fumarate reductase cytochrome b subunit
MSSRTRFFGSSVGTKILIGATGLGLVIYLLVHIAGNVMVFLGQDAFNQYAATLAGNPLIPAIEVALLVIFLIHIYRTVAMYLANRKARPTPYVVKKRAGPPSRKSAASSTMILTGLWLLAFIIIHVKTFRFGEHYERNGVVDLYRIEMETFASPLTVAFYVVSMLLVGSHLWHGASSAFQSLGLENPKWTPRILAAAKVLAAGIAGGFIVIALWAYLVARQGSL